MLFIFWILAVVVGAALYKHGAKGFMQAGLVIAAIGILRLMFSFVALIPAGHAGVIDVFGSVSDRILTPGINLVNPLARVIVFSTQTQELKETMQVPSKEGLTIDLDVSLIFHVQKDKLPELYKTVGENYQSVIILPQLRAVVRGVTATYEAKALYTSERDMLGKQISGDLSKNIEPRGITAEAALLRQMALPPDLSNAIVSKLKLDQESQQMEFVLSKERKEADRKRIEAQGIADFQKIVSQGLTSQLLQWKGIEATLKLADSKNSKVVLVGRSKDGLPLILDTKE